MAQERFNIYIDRLRDGNIENLNEEFSSDFLMVDSEELAFKDPVLMKGQAYVVDNELIIHCTLTTYATLPCAICNAPVKSPLSLDSIYLTENIDNIRSGIYSFKSQLREAILLESPKFAECFGDCPMRVQFAKYLGKKKNEDPHTKKVKEGYYQPFQDLNLNE